MRIFDSMDKMAQNNGEDNTGTVSARAVELPTWVRETKHGVLVQLHIQPNAARTEVVGEHGDALKVRIASLAVDGKANKELIGVLAELCDVALTQVQLIRGASGRRKQAKIFGITIVQAIERLAVT